MKQNNLEKIEGFVDEIVFQNSDNGFTVMVLDVENEPVNVVGVMPGVCEGEQLQVQGYYTTHATFGRQFKAVLFTQSMPKGAYAVEKYLSSGAIKGIGPALARRIVGEFGENTLEIIESSHEKLAGVKGISLRTAETIHDEFMKVYGLKTVMSSLSDLGLTPPESVAVYRRFLQGSLLAIKSNPYVLCSAEIGLDFSRADEIAFSLGIERNDSRRIQAGCVYALDYNFEKEGHSCIPYQKLVSICAQFLSVSEDATEIELSNCVDRGIVCHDFIKDNQGFVYLPKAYYAERYIAKRIRSILKESQMREGNEFNKKIRDFERANKIKYDALQKNAIADALNRGFLILTGGPGTGKTTTLNAIISIYKQSGYSVSICAPTGRAAKRVTELTGHDAKTIHRLLEVQFDRDETFFVHNESNPLKADVVVVDEFSMVDLLLFESLLRALKPNARLILVGDKDQLPSVGCGSLIKDFTECPILPIVHLKQVFRQAAESLIVTNAHKIVQGLMPDLRVRNRDFFFLEEGFPKRAAQTVVDLVSTRLPASYGYSSTADIQVLCPSKIGDLGTKNLNRLLQEKLNPPSEEKDEHIFGEVIFRVGDKVMQNKNDYELFFEKDDGSVGKGVFNGDIGEIESVSRAKGTMKIRYDDRVVTMPFDNAMELEHAYAITVHKSQGSEFEAVILPLMGYHKNLHYRKLLYTAVTRAKKLLIIVGQKKTITNMVDTHKKNTRYSTLNRFLVDGEN
jgi:exodeoxyribonuclease V alpha subunit